MQIRALYERALKQYREGGILSVGRRFVEFTSSFVSNGFQTPSYQVDERVDFEQRFNLMRNEIESSDANLLDIGCADGLLTIRFHEGGLFCLGVDQSEFQISLGRSRVKYESGIGFLTHDITPESIESLPNFDVTLLLTVYHHWCRRFGRDASENMLRRLAEKTDKLFFEPPGRDLSEINLTWPNNKSLRVSYEEYLSNVLGDTVTVKYLGTVPYTGGERTDPVFLIDCSEFREAE